MWRLKIVEGGSPWLRTNNNHVGRQVWEFHPNLGKRLRRSRRLAKSIGAVGSNFKMKHSSDIPMRTQFAKENPPEPSLPHIRLSEHEVVTEKSVSTSLRWAISRYSTLQAHDGHWPGDYGGPMFLMPGLVLGVFDWSGNNPLPPEMWLLLYFLPVHPGRMWCHCRMVYLPMSYIYGKRFVGPITPTVLSLRKELFNIPYDQIDWNLACNQCAKEDLYYPHPLVQDILWASLHKAVEPILMHWPCNKLREKALKTAMEHIHYEDENTRYICIGPVNKVLYMLCCWVEDRNSEAFKLHLPRIYDYLWLAEDGMKMQGYNGSQLWDTAFSVQAIIATGFSEEFGPTLKNTHRFVKDSQVLEDCPGDLRFWYRHICKGAWPFSTADHGWPISDCIAEGLKASLLLSLISPTIVGDPIATNRPYDAVNVILSLMNPGGGFATYELTRSYAWLEIINPAETFGDVIIDYPYVECTSASIQALTSFRKLYTGHRRDEIENCITKAVRFIEKIQKPDGSWYGSWAVCFTYATWFGVKGLIAGGKNYQNRSCIRKSCDFLLSKQLALGGWGESYLSCQNKVYTNLEGNRTHAVNTSWAMLALLDAGQEIMGVFNRNGMISYSAYRNIFPIWTLGEYRTRILCLSEKH